MATIKSLFPVRKSNRLSKKPAEDKLSGTSGAEDSSIIHTASYLANISGHGSPNKVQTFRNSFVTKSDTSDSLSPASKSSSSPHTPASPRYGTPASLSRNSSSHHLPGISIDELTKVCKHLLSPVKRKSDDENDCSRGSVSPIKRKSGDENDCCRGSVSPVKRKSDDENDCSRGSVSPVKIWRLSTNETSSPKSRLSFCGFTSPNRSHSSPLSAAVETPKSSRRPSKTLPIVPTSTPRRLFGSPSKLDSTGEYGTPAKNTEDSFYTPCSTPSRLSTPVRPRSAAKPYQSAKRSLHTAKPDRLIGRDSETAELEDFICDKLDNGTSGSLYVSGAPGTGKTVVVNHVIDKLQSEYGGLRTAFINCMTLKDSNAVFQQVHEKLTGSSVKTKDTVRAMEVLFTASDECIVLVLDEIDQLDSKHHHILYRIFEWPALENSKLVLIGIANALDLTDRVLPRLQASKACRPTLMNFSPYTSIQITEILKYRLQRDSIVEPSAVNFCARKVSAVAGDVRKALDICRRAVEMVEAESRRESVLKPTDCNSPTKKEPSVALKKVTMTHISKVMSDVYGSSVSAANSSENDVPLQQKLAVCSLLVLVKNGKLKEVHFGKLHDTYAKVCRRQQMAPVDQSEFNSILSLLDSRGVIMLKKAKDTRLTKVSLKFDEQELEQTLKDKVLMAAILKHGIPK